jgi:hypothetical protein
VRYAKDARLKRSGQGLQLTFNRKHAPKIMKVNVTVHGLSGEARVVPAGSGSRDEITQIFQLRPEAGAVGLLQSEIWMQEMNTVRWVDLTQIEYVDGSVWRASEGSRCRATPDMFVLVAGTR